jgi:hypothetical protein
MKNPALLGSEGNDDIEQALSSLKESMARRESQIDPTMLAISRGFFAPTKTGSFGESLGNVAESYLKAQPEAEKQAQENAMLRLQMAQLGAQTKQQKSAQQFLQNRLTPPTVGGEAPSQTEGTLTDTTKVPTSKGNLSREQISMISLTNPQLGAILEKEYKDKIDEIGTQPGFIFNKVTGKVTPVVNPGGELKPEIVPEVGRTYMMDPLDAITIREARRKGDVETVNKIIDQYENGVKANAPVELKPTYASTDMSVEAREARKQRDTAEALERGKGAGKRTDTQIAMGEAATDSRIVAQTLKDLSYKEGMDQIWGLFEHPTVGSAIGRLVESGRFGVPEIRDALTKVNIKLPPIQGETPAQYQERKQALLDQASLGFSKAAQLQFEASKLAQGQGTISDSERKSFAETTISKRDTVGSLRLKADMMIERSKFLEDVSKKLVESDMSYDKWRYSPEGKKAVAEYEARLSAIVNPRGDVSAPVKATGTLAPKGKTPYELELERRQKGGK